jgi:hypothetical protein
MEILFLGQLRRSLLQSIQDTICLENSSHSLEKI